LSIDSANIFFNSAFSFSNSLSRLASAKSIYPLPQSPSESISGALIGHPLRHPLNILKLLHAALAAISLTPLDVSLRSHPPATDRSRCLLLVRWHSKDPSATGTGPSANQTVLIRSLPREKKGRS
jgi:hypothetical protein